MLLYSNFDNIYKDFFDKEALSLNCLKKANDDLLLNIMKLKALKYIMKQLIILLLVLVAGYKGKSQTITVKDSSLHSLADSLRMVSATPQTKVKTTVVKTKTVAAASLCDGSCPLIAAGYRPLIGWILIVGIMIVFLLVAAHSNLLKDQITDQVTFLQEAQQTLKYQKVTNPNNISRPYSLYRSQLGLWTIVIGCSYLYVELCRGYAICPITIDSGLLVLMGISAGTAAVGNVIDHSNQLVPHHQDSPSQGFFLDVLSDQAGVSIHRFQHVIWTLIAVTIYIFQLQDVDCKHLPTLDPTLIALTGISSLTYLGLKINENKPVVPPAGHNPPA